MSRVKEKPAATEPSLEPHVRRLITSKENWETTEFKDCYELGRQWVRKEAEYDEVKRVAKFRERNDADRRWPEVLEFEEYNDGLPADHQLAYLIAGHEIECREVAEMMERIFGQPTLEAKGVEGFIEGAMEEWSEACQKAGGQLD